jgi:adiponectin receptor
MQEHLKDNPHILNYYRSGYNFKKSLRSLFSLHNETGNIWTHLVGAWGEGWQAGLQQ